MKTVVFLLLDLLTALAKLLRPGGARAVIAENLLLKRQMTIHSRSRQRAPNLTTSDRILMGFFSLFLTPRRINRAAVIIKPSTLLSYHNELKKRKYRLLYSARGCRKPGPKGPSSEVIKAIVGMKRRNPRFGCPRIAQQINLAFGLDLDKDTVRRVLAAYYKPGPGGRGPSWLTTLGHARDSLWSIDLFRAESITLKTHWVLVVMDQFTRRIIGFAAQAGNVDGPTLCRMFNDAATGKPWPLRISSDNDPVFQYHRWKATLRILDIEDIKSLPYVPMSHSFVERLIGSTRRELLDQTFFWTATDLVNKLREYQHYYNEHRCHSRRDGATPVDSEPGDVIDIHDYRWEKHCRGLFQLPVTA